MARCTVLLCFLAFLLATNAVTLPDVARLGDSENIARLRYRARRAARRIRLDRRASAITCPAGQQSALTADGSGSACCDTNRVTTGSANQPAGSVSDCSALLIECVC
jgi:hypothetical protein